MTDIIERNAPMLRAELDVQINTAKAYPRNVTQCVEEALMLATMDEETAESCFYCLFRNDKNGGKSEIRGPSVRLAEIVTNAWGNLHAAARIIENDGKFITAEAVAWDLEKNVKISSEVKRRITGRDGRTFNDDLQVVTGNAACAIAFRNAVFKVLPKTITEKIYKAAVQKAIGDETTLNKKREAAINYFGKMGVTKETILEALNKQTINDIDLKDIETLIGIKTAISEGSVSIENAFTYQYAEEVKSKAQLLNEKLKG